MNSATLKTTYKNNSGEIVVATETMTGDLEQNVEREQIAAGAVDVRFDLNVPFAKILAMGLGCKRSPAAGGVPNDGDVRIHIKTNSTSAPDDEFDITPQAGYSWSPSSLNALLVTANITALYVSNQGTAKADIAFRFLVDSTPGLAD